MVEASWQHLKFQRSRLRLVLACGMHKKVGTKLRQAKTVAKATASKPPPNIARPQLCRAVSSDLHSAFSIMINFSIGDIRSARVGRIFTRLGTSTTDHVELLR